MFMQVDCCLREVKDYLPKFSPTTLATCQLSTSGTSFQRRACVGEPHCGLNCCSHPSIALAPHRSLPSTTNRRLDISSYSEDKHHDDKLKRSHNLLSGTSISRSITCRTVDNERCYSFPHWHCCAYFRSLLSARKTTTRRVCSTLPCVALPLMESLATWPRQRCWRTTDQESLSHSFEEVPPRQEPRR